VGQPAFASAGAGRFNVGQYSNGNISSVNQGGSGNLATVTQGTPGM
jgi:hypothetical protein